MAGLEIEGFLHWKGLKCQGQLQNLGLRCKSASDFNIFCKAQNNIFNQSVPYSACIYSAFSPSDPPQKETQPRN